jgi:TonB family protein
VWVTYPIRFVRHIAAVLALLLALSGVCVADVLPTTAPAEPALCPIGLRVDKVKDHDDELVFSLWSDDEAGKATGTFVLYAGTQRYRIAFAEAVAADVRDTKIEPTPIVVQFSPGTQVESGYIASLNGDPCLVHSPFVKSSLQTYVQTYGPSSGTLVYPDWAAALKTFFADASAMSPLVASDPEIVDAPSCARPYVMAYTRTPSSAITPPGFNFFDGDVDIRVAVAAIGDLLGMRIDKSSRQKPIDAAALAAAARSRFAPQIYRCNPVTGNYIFVVAFGVQ